ncbi:endonuclease [Flavipsychrobacter stenotrophus]|uniref:Endonuclease n=1 Tax=Flavipsychrobacter stenotrophus TaxID=2077091 RepID=A0A2S7T2S2_9BACT|nr:endonuclease/exonuclease/phosphatase family protein [Flavipsychrobacter stenotrophus]PQJ13056.1 endonuclease [Flavipsychrobacter stenotrophus]
MMQRITSILAIFVFLSAAVSAQHITIGTYNLRYDNPADAGNLWKDRAPTVASLIKFYDFDILGTQEGLKNQLDDISTALPIYARYGVGRDDGIDAGEHSAIFFKKDRFILKDKGDFWLSETPDKPTLGWDATCCKRICSWVQLKDKQSGKMLWVFNAHYDHQGQIAREESSKLILKKIKEIAGDNIVILTGDLNGGYSTDCYKIIATSGTLKDTYEQADHPYTNNPSFNGFGKQIDGSDIIDHIFTTKHFKIKRWGILSDTYHGKYPSDHFPVLAEVEY